MCWLKPGGIWWDTPPFNHQGHHRPMNSHLAWGFTLDSSMKMVISFCTFGPSHGVNEYMGRNIKSWFGLYLSYLVWEFGVDNFWQFYWEGWNSSFSKAMLNCFSQWRWVEFFCLSWQMDPQKGLLIKWQTFGSADCLWFLGEEDHHGSSRYHGRDLPTNGYPPAIRFSQLPSTFKGESSWFANKIIIEKSGGKQDKGQSALKMASYVIFRTLVPLKKKPMERVFLDIEKNVSLR